MIGKISALAIPMFVILDTGCGAPDAPGTRVSVDAVPVVDLTNANPAEDALFEYPSGATRLFNGHIVVNDYWAARLLYFDSAGKLIRKIGGHGQGPNEFGGALVWRGQCARDSVFTTVFDRMQVLVLDTSGLVRRTFSPPPDWAFSPCLAGSPLVRFQGSMTRVPRPGDPPLRGELLMADLYGSNEKSLGEFVLGDYGPAQPVTHAFARRDRVYLASGESDAVEVYSTNGQKLKTLRLGVARPALTDAHYDAALEQFVAYLVLRDDRRRMKEFFRQRFPKPSRGPAFTSLHVDDQNVLWVTTSLFGDPTELRAFAAADGRPVGSARFTVDLRILEIGGDYLLAAFEDEEGFPHVARYAVSRKTEARR